MYILECWIEHPVRSLDRTFTYLCEQEVQPGCRVLVDFNHRAVIGFVETVKQDERSADEIAHDLQANLKFVQEVIDPVSFINEELHDLAVKMHEDTLSTMISCFQCILPPKIRPSSRAKKAVMEKWVRPGEKQVSLTPKQLEAYMYVVKHTCVRYSELRKNYPAYAKKLVDLGAVILFEKEKEAGSTVHPERTEPLSLTPSQQSAMAKILYGTKSVCLLRGVTGSGKTEIYLQLAASALQKGQQVLILVPEISLTPQMIERVSARFGEELAIYHSGLNEQEKYEQYQKVNDGRARIVVGTRSAVFLPFSKLGLIVMDEEHDTSYKQDKQPSYHCRDIAIYRAKKHQCKLILGSATPSLDSYARALKGVYDLVEMTDRVNRTLPKVDVVSMKDELAQGNTVLSSVLLQKMEERFKAHEKVILLLNRRGYSTLLRCRDCDEAVMCPHCELAMSYHRSIGRLKCHFCGTEIAVPKVCPSCGSKAGFMTYGFGTERLEQEVKDQFPGISVLRMDADTTTRKNSHDSILKKFADGEAQVLLGTQMIAKGLDFPDVTLVGVIGADRGLEHSDFRSCEMTFDLLMQAAGRSGRAERPGEVVYQVFDPNHYAIQCAAMQDYQTFFKMEMEFRYRGQYPPYTYMIALVVQDRVEKKAFDAAQWLQQGLYGDFKTIGVTALAKLRDLYRYRVILKGKDLDVMRKEIRRLFASDDQNRVNMIRIDVEPMTLDH